MDVLYGSKQGKVHLLLPVFFFTLERIPPWPHRFGQWGNPIEFKILSSSSYDAGKTQSGESFFSCASLYFSISPMAMGNNFTT